MESAPAQAASVSGKWRPEVAQAGRRRAGRRPQRGPPRRRRCARPDRRPRGWSRRRGRAAGPGRPRSGARRSPGPTRRPEAPVGDVTAGPGPRPRPLEVGSAVVTLMLRRSPGTTRTVAPARLDQGGVVGGLGLAARGPGASQSARKAWGVWTATSPSALDGRDDASSRRRASTVSARARPGTAAVGAGRDGVHHGPEQRRRGQRAGAVVDHDHRRRRRAPPPARPGPTPTGWRRRPPTTSAP